MTKLLIRHALSEANNRENYGTPAFDNPESPLMPKGRVQAAELGARLINEYGIDLYTETAAVSAMRRSQETALVAGFKHLHIYSELDEEKGGLSDQEILKAIAERRPPQAARAAALYIIENPPEEKIIVAHGLSIATICQELGIYQDQRFIPAHCEVREVCL